MSYTGFYDSIPNPLQPVGGGYDRIFYENSQTVTTDYTITDGNNAMTAGPITVQSGVTVTIPAGSTWSII
jgi:hypothetical protein